MRLTVVFIFLFWGVSSFAQTYPVHVQVNVSPPYSFYLSDYVSGSRERVSVALLNRDVQYSSMPVRLRIMVKGNGYRLQSLPYASVAPLILEPNVPYRLSMEELRPYFDPHNLSGQGLGASGYLKGSRLPEGPVEFSVEVLEYQTNRLLSRAGSAMIFLSLQKPPQLGLPFDGAILAWQEPLHFQFQWTPRHSGVARVEYELVIKELWDTGMDPSSAFSFAPEIFRERVVSTSYTYGPMCPPLEPGHVYAWCVRVVAKDGIDDVRVFENDGLSVIRTFRIGSYCPSPLSLQLLPDRGNLEVSWESAPEHREYRVTYRLKDASNWHEQRAYSSPCQLFGVRSGQTYECKVDGVCEDGTVSSTLVQTVTLPSEDTSRQRNCGVLPPVDLSNTTPLEELYEGDLFWAGDFPVQVTSSSGRAGIFSGEGNVVVPYLLFHRFAVRFDNVFLNSERRLVRGFVEAVYDETDGSIGNLDDIFEGGSSTGEVVSGITYADIDVSFTLPGDGSYSYDSVSSQIHVYDGDDEVGVIDVGGILSSSGEGGSSVSGESVFPITVKDSAGNLYSLAPDPDTPSGSSGGVALKVRKVGSSGGAFPGGSIVYDRLDRDIGVVSFRDAEGSRYEFDCWHPSYGSALLIRDKYERLDGDYYVACKLLPSGASDRVVAHLDVHGSGVDPAKVRFVTRGGTEYTPESFDGESGDYVLSLVGGRENDGQELYALYPKPDSGYYNLGKLLVLSYPSYRFSVKVVSVGGGLPSGEFSGIRDYLSGFFSRYGIACDVSYDETDYSDLELFDKGSGILSAYNSRMKSFQRDYASTHEIDASSSYLFIFPESGHKGKRDFSGFMPRGCQFGYVFRQDFRGFDSFCLAVVHELCHGRFVLKHTFDSSYGLVKGSTDNLMDYTEGASHLAKWQWDVIHDPGVVMRIFERDKDVMIIVNRNKNTVTIRWEQCTPQLIAGKKLLKYDAVCSDMKENVTYYRLVNDGGIVAHYLDNSLEVIHKYSITFDKSNWHTLSLSSYQNDCLSCELTSLLGQMVVETGKLAGSYAFPGEDLYILVTGEDFDGEESSRIAAGGFLVLELVQVGKVAKFIKGGKILARGGREVDMSVRIFKQFVKKTAEDAVIDLSAQFLVGFVKNAVIHPEEDGYEIAKRALLDVKLQDAIVSGMIDYASFDSRTQTAFDCALKVFSRIEKNGIGVEISTLSDGVWDCFTILGVRYILKYMKHTSQYKELVSFLQDAHNYDIVLKKISDILSQEAIEDFIQILLENSIQATYGK